MTSLTLMTPGMARDVAWSTPAAQWITLISAGGAHRLCVRLADTPQERARGLMFQPKLHPDEGMLFIYTPPTPLAMWMRNTPIPLDMLFFDAQGVVRSIITDTVPYSEEILPSLGPTAWVLELAAGRVRDLGLRPGDRLALPLAPLLGAAQPCRWRSPLAEVP